MTEPDLDRYLDDLADQVPHVDPPLLTVLTAGRVIARRRRQRRTAVGIGAVAAAVAAVFLGPGLLVQQQPMDVSRPATTTDPIPAPAGMKLVGAEGVAIAVPDVWTYEGAQPCPFREADSWAVVRGDELVQNGVTCRLSMPAPQPFLQVDVGPVRQTDPPVGGGFALEGTTLQAGAGEAVERSRGCTRPDADFPSCTAIWDVPDRDVRFSVWLGGPDSNVEELRAVVDAMDASLQALPKGWIASPVDGTVVRADEPVPAPDGMRLVGFDGVAVAVPDTWGHPYQVCGPSSYGFYGAGDVPPVAECQETSDPPGDTLLLFADRSDEPGFTCTSEGCRGTWTHDGVSLTAALHDPKARDTLELIRDSTQTIPDGWAASPVDGGLYRVDGPPPAPPGMKLVGGGGIAVAVPETWSPDQPRPCGPTPSTYAVEFALARSTDGPACGLPILPQPVDHLLITVGTPTVESAGVRCGDAGCSARWVEGDVTIQAYADGVDARAILEEMGATVQVLSDELITSTADHLVVPVDEFATEPSVAPGERLVGAGGLAVAVPWWWIQSDCPQRPQALVFQNSIGVCLGEERGDRGTDQLLIESNGGQVTFSRHPAGVFEPESLPTGWTTVPAWPTGATSAQYRSLLTGAGLADAVRINGPGRTVPEQGSVVRLP